MNTLRILNIDLHDCTTEELLLALSKGVVFTPNIDHFVLLQKDVEFYTAYKRADFVVLDSQVVFLLQKLRKNRFREKISGADFFPRFCLYQKHNPKITLCLLGGLNETARKVKDTLNAQCGREIVVEAISPSLGFETDPEECARIVTTIQRSGANVLAVALGTPKQEKWIARYKDQLPGIEIFMGVGAAFDFLVGEQKRAPRIMQKAGLEWLYRLSRQPKRLAKRYLVQDLPFFYFFVLDILDLYKDPYGQ